MCSRWRTRWATRCTRCCPTSASRLSIRTTRSSSPKCRRRCRRRCFWITCSTAPTTDEQIVLLQHAIDNITSTFYTQVLFADFELAAHERVEADEPITAEVLNASI